VNSSATQSPPPATSPQRRPKLADRFALWLLKLAKLRRRNFTDVQGDNYDQFYEEFFDEKDLELYERDRRLTLRRETINRFLETHAGPGQRVIDVGCGLGDVLAGLSGDFQLFGMDYAKSNVVAATRRLGQRAVIKQGSIYEIPFDSGAFDVALCLEVLEHIEDDARGVRDIARVLKPGGFLIAAVPYTYYWPEYMSLMGHFRHYTRESFTRLMEENGLKVEAYLPNYPNWHQTYTRRYAMIRAQAMTAGRLIGRRELHAFRWPGQGAPSLDRLVGKLEPMRMRDAVLNYAQLETSTFLVARKPPL
jgi:2-polyprenyl-3-methyl-5-hydroxy-6-metoxy-1,4-benzoquinol methylase